MNVDEKVQVYAVKHKDYDVRMASRSGGIFTALSDYILEQQGVVYGCVLDENFKATHIRAESFEQRNLMRGSKYVQSDMGASFKSVKEDLSRGKYVLFSGTSCQIAGLKSFLGKAYERLLCIDIVCHGVPSPLVWEKYLLWQEKNVKAKCVKVDFRNKKDYGWRKHVETLEYKDENGNVKVLNSEIFKELFYGHNILRPSCYNCPYKSVSHPGDITIADYWGIEKAAPEFDDDKGVSLVLVNNDYGMSFIENIKDRIEAVQCRIEDSIQPPLVRPFEQPKERGQFWSDFKNKKFGYVVRKYGKHGLIEKILRKFKRLLLGWRRKK